VAFNGNGTFSQLYNWVTDAANGLFVSSSRMQAECQDIADGLSTCITKDGQTTVTADIPMAGFKFTGLGLGSSSTDSATIQNANSSINEFRLTLSTGVPVADVTNATTIYCCPYVGNHIALYTSGAWVMRTSAQFSLALGTLTSGRPYDVFCYDNSGVPTLEFLIWTSITVRATALAYQDGVLVKSGDATRRYLGTFTPNTTTQVSDNATNRNLSNYYNRVCKKMSATVGATGYTYTTATWRQANGGALEQLQFTVGVAEDVIPVSVSANAANSSATIEVAVGIGVDSTSSPSATTPKSYTGAANIASTLSVSYDYATAVGYHYLAWLEYSAATGTTTWNTTVTTSGVTPSIIGKIWC